VLQECKKCNLIFQEYIPDDFVMDKLYNEWIDPKIVLPEQRKHNLQYYKKLSTEVSNIIDYFNTTPNNLSFLDFGMGWAQWCLMVKAFGAEAMGIELSQDRIKNAKENAIKVLSWDDIRNYKLDFINTEQVFEHIPKPLDTLKYLSSSLKPNGLIKISVPNGNVATRNLKIMDWKAPKNSRNSLNFVAPLEHINSFRTKTIKTMAELCGLQHVSVPFKDLAVKDLVKSKLKPLYYQLFRGGREGTYLFFRKL
jgi:2-polyprenyl-3-methyl-5-hydroxy-6-metoxy-1,4-benzoquinol methylase